MPPAGGRCGLALGGDGRGKRHFAGANLARGQVDRPLADIAAPGREDRLVVRAGILVEARGKLGEELRGLLFADGAERTEIGTPSVRRVLRRVPKVPR